MSDCRTCAPPQTCVSDLDRYSLQEDTFWWNANCPPGVDCSSLMEITVICCDGEELNLVFPESVTPAIRQLLLNSLLSEAGRRLAFCDPPVIPGTPTTPIQLYWNGPQSCTVLCPNGSGFTYTVRAGRYLAFNRVDADRRAHNEACRLARLHKFCLSDLPATWPVSTAFSRRVNANGPGVTDVMRWSSTGTLPDGLTLDEGFIMGHRSTLQGTPTTPGTFNFSITAVASDGDYMTRDYTMEITGTANQPYAYFKCDEASPITQLNNSIDAFHLPLQVGIPGVSVAGKISTALELGIANRNFWNATDAHWLLGANFTVRFWYKPQLGWPSNMAIFLNNDESFQIQRWEDLNFTVQLRVRTTDGYKWATSSPLTTNAWHLVICWFEQGVGLGVKIDNSASVLTAVAYPLEILFPSYLYLTMSHFVGNEAIDEIAIWKKKLSDPEMLYDWNSGNGRTYP